MRDPRIDPRAGDIIQIWNHINVQVNAVDNNSIRDTCHGVDRDVVKAWWLYIMRDAKVLYAAK